MKTTSLSLHAMIMKHKGIDMKSPSINRMRTISVVWGLFLVLLLVGLTTIGMIYKHKSQSYKTLEADLKTAAIAYAEKKALYTGTDLKISSDELIKEEQIEPLKVNDGDCSGYVLIKKVREHYEHESYIKCDKYTTKGYDKN